MNWLDITIIVVLALSTLIGLKTGLVRWAVTFIGLILGVFLAGHYYMPLSERLSPWIGDGSLAKVVAFASILLAMLIAAMIAAGLLRNLASLLLLGWVDRLGGAILGLAVGAVACGALLMVIDLFSYWGLGAAIQESKLATLFLEHLPLLGLLPQEFDRIRSLFKPA